jgi:bacteriorhodopsin
MKISCLFSLVVASAGSQDSAQESQAAQGASDQSYTAPAAQDSQAYAAPAAQSYAVPSEAYSAPSYTAAEAPAYVAAPKCCVSACPSHAPYFNVASCACVAGIEYASPAYEAQHYEQPSYAAQSAQSYGEQEESSGYRKLMVQPRGTIDTRNNTLGSTGRVATWVGFGILFLCAWIFLNRGLTYSGYANSDTQHRRYLAFLSSPLIAEGFVCLIASLAYLTMATGNGSYTRCCDGRQFLFARYIDWVLTTPIMLHTLVHFAGGSDDEMTYIFFMDVLMIVAGLIASLVCDGWKWFFFAFSMLCFIPILHLICQFKTRPVDLRFDNVFFFWNYANIANLTVLAWFLYPIVWILSEGTNTLSVDGEAVFYTVLDIIAKCLLGLFVLNSRSIYNEDNLNLKALKEALEGQNIDYQE